MKIFFIILTTLFYSMSIQGQQQEIIYLWPDTVPGETEAKHPPVQTDNTSGDVIRLTDITNPAFVVYEPEQKNASRAAIIVCPGGGYSILAADKEGYEVAEWLNSLGYTAFVLQYRVPDKQEGALQDIQRAIRVIRNTASKYDININKIGVLGFSAGGSLCARLASRFMYDSYPAIDAADTISSRPDFAMLIYSAYLDKGIDGSITPELTIPKTGPPFFIFGTADDRHGNSSLVMASFLRSIGVPADLHFLAKGGHGYGLRSSNVAAETWPQLAEVWLGNL